MDSEQMQEPKSLPEISEAMAGLKPDAKPFPRGFAESLSGTSGEAGGSSDPPFPDAVIAYAVASGWEIIPQPDTKIALLRLSPPQKPGEIRGDEEIIVPRDRSLGDYSDRLHEAVARLCRQEKDERNTPSNVKCACENGSRGTRPLAQNGSRGTRCESPIFISGTGRCGTSILAHTLLIHPDLMYFAEPRFLCDPGGLNDLLEKSVSYADFRKGMTSGRFWERLVASTRLSQGDEFGARVYPRQVIETALDQAFGTVACAVDEGGITDHNARSFLDALFGVGMAAANKSRWMEKTPQNFADMLYRLYPKMRYIHVFRDPRDVCASLLARPTGPNSVAAFIPWYLAIMERAKRAQQDIPRENYLPLCFEDLVADPEAYLPAIMEWADLRVDDAIMEYMRGVIKPESAHLGRWRQHSPIAEMDLVDKECSPIYREWRARGRVDRVRKPPAPVCRVTDGRFCGEKCGGIGGTRFGCETWDSRTNRWGRGHKCFMAEIRELRESEAAADRLLISILHALTRDVPEWMSLPRTSQIEIMLYCLRQSSTHWSPSKLAEAAQKGELR